MGITVCQTQRPLYFKNKKQKNLEFQTFQKVDRSAPQSLNLQPGREQRRVLLSSSLTCPHTSLSEFSDFSPRADSAHPKLSIFICLRPCEDCHQKGGGGIVSSHRAVGEGRGREGWPGEGALSSPGSGHRASNPSASHWGVSTPFLCHWSPFVPGARGPRPAPFVLSSPACFPLTTDNDHLSDSF